MIISFLSTVGFAVYCAIGFYYLLQDRRSLLNRYFFLFCLSFALWSLSKAILAAETGSSENVLWQKAGYIGALTYEVFILKFFLHLTGINRRIKWIASFNVLIWILPLLFIYMNLVHNAVHRDIPSGFWYIGMHVLANVYNLLSILIIIKWVKSTQLIREQKQGMLIIISGVITIILTLGADFFSGYADIISGTPVLIFIWVGSLLYASQKYRFMGITTSIMNNEILSQIDDYIAVLDTGENILRINNSLSLVTAARKGDKAEKLFNKFDWLHGKLGELVQGCIAVLPVRLHINGNGEESVVIQGRFSLLRDQFSDILGILFVGRKIKSLDYIKRIYSLTSRELEIIEEIISGLTNRAIAEDLHITQNTLKAHITNIYNKMGVNNKIELINILKEFDIEVGASD